MNGRYEPGIIEFMSIRPEITVVALFVLCSVVSGQTPETAVFPKLTAANLSGKSMTMPAGFAGEYNVVLIAFEREQQKNIETWLAVVPKMLEAFPRVAYYELPTIAKLNGMTRFFIDTGMRSGIHDKAQRDRTITLFIDKKPFKDSLRIESEKTVYAMLIDRNGNVLWRADGDSTPEKLAGLKAAVEKLAK
jgi:hypothetical protein